MRVRCYVRGASFRQGHKRDDVGRPAAAVQRPSRPRVRLFNVCCRTRRERDGQRTNEDDDHFAGLSLTDVVFGAGVGVPDYSRAQFEVYDREVYQAMLTSTGNGGLNWLVGVEFLRSGDDVVTEPLDCLAYTGVLQASVPGCFVGTSGALAGTSLTARTAGRRAMNNDTFEEDLESLSLSSRRLTRSSVRAGRWARKCACSRTDVTISFSAGPRIPLFTLVQAPYQLA